MFRCSHTSTGDAVDKLVDYFLTKMANPRISGSVQEVEDLLEKAAKLLHQNHYIVTLLKIKACISKLITTGRVKVLECLWFCRVENNNMT